MRLVLLGLALTAWVGAVRASSSHERAPSRARVLAGEACDLAGRHHTAALRDGRPVYVERPSVLTDRDEVLLLGGPSWIWGSAERFSDAAMPTSRPTPIAGLRVRRGSLTPIPAVLPGDVAKGLRAVRTRSGVLALWVSSSATAPGEQTLWSARLVGGKWTTPAEVLTAATVEWSVSSSAVLADGDRVHLVVLSRSRRGGTTGSLRATYARSDGASWAVSELATGEA